MTGLESADQNHIGALECDERAPLEDLKPTCSGVGQRSIGPTCQHNGKLYSGQKFEKSGPWADLS